MAALETIKIMLILITIILMGGYTLYKYKNRRIKPDCFEVYKTQDTVPIGKVGVFVTALIMPPSHDNVFWYNVSKKIFNTIIPWPFRILAEQDNGIALCDPIKFYEFEEFTPTKLVDPNGNDCYLDGEPYINKYKRGEVVWVPPAKMIHKDNGYFLYKKKKGGMPSLVGKFINKSRIWYYDKGLVQKKIPHWEETFKIIHGAIDRIKTKYGNIEWLAASSIYSHDMKTKLYNLLDAGCDTIILAAPIPIYSHFEEFNSSFYHCFEYIHEWENEHPGKKIKVIMAPQIGNFKSLRKSYLAMLKDRLDMLPEKSSVTVAVTVHGMPWDAFKWEAWIELAPVYRDKLFEEMQELLTQYKFSRKNMVICQDEFADHIWDPQKKYLSTNRAYWNAINDGYDYVIGIPIEFLAENTDSMFHHALKNYDGFDDYVLYTKLDYPNWSIPFTVQFQQRGTTVIYNGVPVGKYQKYVIDAFYESIDSILKQK